MSIRFRTATVVAALAIVCSAAAGLGAGSASAHSRPAAHPVKLKLKNAGYLTVGSDATYPPMESYDSATHQYVGADIDLANALAKAMGLKGAKIVNHTFDTIILSLQKGDYDVVMSSMNDTPDREKQIAFVDYMRASEGIVVRASSGIHANGYSQMCGHSVAVEDGTTEAFGLDAANKKCSSRIDIKKFPQDTAAFQAFALHKADAYSGDLPVAALYAKNSHGQFVLAGKPFAAGQNYGIGLLKNNPGLKTALIAALQKIRKNGTYKTILSRWGVGGASL